MGEVRFPVTNDREEDYTVFWFDVARGVQIPNRAKYDNIHGCSVELKVKGPDVEFQWKNERGKVETKHKTGNPIHVYGLMVTVRLAGYESAQLTHDCPPSATAAIQSASLPLEIVELSGSAATVLRLAAVGESAAAGKLLGEIWPRVGDLRYCALTTLSKAIHPAYAPLPRGEWLEAVRSHLSWAQGA